MPFTRRKIRRIVKIHENGRGKLFYLFMASIAFAISGVLDREPQLPVEPPSPEINHSDNGRRYCDPPNMTSLAIYFDSREDNADEDYDLMQNQEMYFQSNLSSTDKRDLETEIFFGLGSATSYVPALFLSFKYGPQRILGYSTLFLLLSSIFGENTYLECFVLGFGSVCKDHQLTGTVCFSSVCLESLFQGVLEYAFYKMTFNYIPSNRSSLISFASMRHLGLAISELLWIMQVNRKHTFYGTVVITVLWFVVWSLVNFKSSINDIHYIRQKSKAKRSRWRFPWRSILGSRPVWMTITAIVGASCGLSCVFRTMKLYLKYVYYLPADNMLCLSNLLHVGFAIICGLSFDYLLISHKFSVTSSRRMIVYVSHFIPAGFIFILGFLGCQEFTPMVFYCLAVMATGANYTGAFSSPLDLAPKYSGSILALCFTFKALGSLLMDYFTLYVLTEQVFLSWRFIFSLNALILLLTAIFFMLRGSGSIQPWNDPDYKLSRERKNTKVQQPRASVVAPLPKPRTKSIYMVEKKILKVLHVQEPDKFTRVRAHSTSLPNDRCATSPPNIYRPSNKKRASIS